MLTHLSPRNLGILSLVVSGGLLLGAYGFEYIGGMDPCMLCLYQRIPHFIVSMVGLALVAFQQRLVQLVLLTALLTLYIASTWLGGFHVGVEFGWWEFSGVCTPDKTFGSVEDMFNQEIVRCDKIAWSLFGISMAGWNMLISLGMLVLTAVAWIRFLAQK